jgi:uncharacterized protein (TIGR02266 family)
METPAEANTMTITEREFRAGSPLTCPADRRTTPRAELHAEIGFRSDTNFYVGFTEDISEGGLFVATHMLRPVGEELELCFTLPNGHEVKLAGVVRWLRDPHDYSEEARPGMGVQFRDVSGVDLAMIREFVALRDPMFFEA